jgi:hypothetical protein
MAIWVYLVCSFALNFLVSLFGAVVELVVSPIRRGLSRPSDNINVQLAEHINKMTDVQETPEETLIGVMGNRGAAILLLRIFTYGLVFAVSGFASAMLVHTFLSGGNRISWIWYVVGVFFVYPAGARKMGDDAGNFILIGLIAYAITLFVMR